jgi:hypothetical protein
VGVEEDQEESTLTPKAFLIMPKQSQAQGRFFGLVKAIQEGKVSSRSVDGPARRAAKSMTSKQVSDFARGPQKGLPERVKRK